MFLTWLACAVRIWAKARLVVCDSLPAYCHGERSHDPLQTVDIHKVSLCPDTCRLLLLGNQVMSFALQCGLGCVYCITAGKSMHAVWNFACTEPCRPFGLSAWIVVFAALQILLSQVNYQMKSAWTSNAAPLHCHQEHHSLMASVTRSLSWPGCTVSHLQACMKSQRLP